MAHDNKRGEGYGMWRVSSSLAATIMIDPTRLARLLRECPHLWAYPMNAANDYKEATDWLKARLDPTEAHRIVDEQVADDTLAVWEAGEGDAVEGYGADAMRREFFRRVENITKPGGEIDLMKALVESLRTEKNMQEDTQREDTGSQVNPATMGSASVEATAPRQQKLLIQTGQDTWIELLGPKGVKMVLVDA